MEEASLAVKERDCSTGIEEGVTVGGANSSGRAGDKPVNKD